MPQGAAHLERTWGLLAFPMAQGPEPEADTPLDLSFLTEEEQEAIANVLQRDAHLRQLEEGRVSKLRASLVDPGQLKVLTGDWFQEARAQRHPRTGVGSDLVRASMRRKKSSRGGQAVGSAGGEAPAEPGPRLQTDDTRQGRLAEMGGPDFPSPCATPRAPDQEAVAQAQGAPSLGGEQACAEEAQREEPPAPPAQVETAPELAGNGHEAPERGRALDRALSSSSSASSLNGSTPSGSRGSLSAESEAEAGAVRVRGSLHVALRYEPGVGELCVHVMQCRGLAAARRRRSDPYVKGYLLPDKQSKRKTAVKKRTLNPVFNETLRYPVPQAALRSRVLSLSVWHRESLGRNVFLGEVRVPLDTWGWDAEPTWLPLQPRVPPSPDGLPSRGLLSLSVKYVPAGSEGAGRPPSGELHFWVKEARELVPLRSGALDSYVQCSVLPDDSQAGRQRTRVIRRSLSPAFNHTMVYDGFGPTDLHQACAELSLWDQGPLASRQLGATRLSLGTGSSYGLLVPWMDSTPEEAQLWRTLLQRPCEWVDGLLPLRTNLVPRTQP